LDRSSFTTKKLLDRQSNVACNLAEQCRRYITTRVERDRGPSAILVPVLSVRASLTRLREPEPFEEPGYLARLQDRN
jgi:hypothetical protein